MTFNPTVPALSTKVEYQARADQRYSIGYSWQDLTDYLAGTISFRLNAASTLTLQIPNADGRHTRFFHPGMEIRVTAEFEDLTNARRIFRGYVPPGLGLSSIASSRDAQLSLYAVGMVGLLNHDYVHVGESLDADGDPQTYTNKGNEVSLAIRREIEAMTYLSPDYQINTKPTNPIISIGDEEEVADGYYTRKDLVDHYLGFAVDDSDPDNPLEYGYYEGFIGSYPRFHFTKLPDPETAPAVRVLDYEQDILTSESSVKANQCTHAICKSSADSQIYEEYQSSSLTRKYGKISHPLEMPSTNRDILQQRARQYVNLNRRPVFAIEVTVPDVPGSYHIGQVVELDNAQYGLAGNYVVTEIVFSFSPSTCNTKLVLSSRRELLSEILTA